MYFRTLFLEKKRNSIVFSRKSIFTGEKITKNTNNKTMYKRQSKEKTIDKQKKSATKESQNFVPMP